MIPAGSLAFKCNSTGLLFLQIFTFCDHIFSSDKGSNKEEKIGLMTMRMPSKFKPSAPVVADLLCLTTNTFPSWGGLVSSVYLLLVCGLQSLNLRLGGSRRARAEQMPRK